MSHRYITPWGVFSTYDHDTVQQAIMKGEFWDQQIQPFLAEADPSGWMLDLGANIGWFTVYGAKRFTGVIAFEAHPETFGYLRRNLVDNQVDTKVWAFNLAAYDRTTRLTLAPDEFVGWPVPNPLTLEGCPHPASIAFVPTLHGDRFSVQAAPVDIFVPPWMTVTCIKVDVQGCDLRALVGLTQTIRRCRPLIIFEYEGGASQWHGDTWEKYLQFFASHNYQVTRIREDLWDYVARPN